MAVITYVWLSDLVPIKHIIHPGLLLSNIYGQCKCICIVMLLCFLLSVSSTLVYHFHARLEPSRVEPHMWLHSNGRHPALPANIVPEWIGLTGHLQIYLLAWFDWCKIKMFQFLNYNHFRKLMEIWQFQILYHLATWWIESWYLKMTKVIRMVVV
jgi:hypothetical protein